MFVSHLFMIAVKKEIMEVLERLPDPNMQTVLELRYLDMKPWNEIRAIMNRCDTNIFRWHKKALAMVQ